MFAAFIPAVMRLNYDFVLETNLERIDDVIAGLNEQRDSLKNSLDRQPATDQSQIEFAKPKLNF